MGKAAASPLPAPPARKTRRQPAEIRARILAAAEEEFKNAGFMRATTLAIARRAEVTEAQLFRYFASKQALFQEAVFEPLVRHFDHFNASHVQNMPDGLLVREDARLYITELQDFIRAHSKMLLSLVFAQAYAPSPTPGVGEIDSLQNYFAKGAAMMSRRAGAHPTVDPRLMVRVSFAAVLANILFKDWLFPSGLANEEEISNAIIDFVIGGITVNHGGDAVAAPLAAPRKPAQK